MLDPDDGDAAALQLEDHVDEFVRLGVGQAAADLVEQQHCRAGGERARELQPFAVDQAERLGAPIGEAGHAGQRQRLDGARVGRVALQAAAVRGGGEDVLEHRHAAERPRDLVRAREAAPAPFGGRQGRHVLAAEAHPPGGRRKRADEHAEQGRLAGPVGADDADRFVGVDREIDGVEDHQRVEALVEPHGVEQRFVGVLRAHAPLSLQPLAGRNVAPIRARRRERPAAAADEISAPSVFFMLSSLSRPAFPDRADVAPAARTR